MQKDTIRRFGRGQSALLMAGSMACLVAGMASSTFAAGLASGAPDRFAHDGLALDGLAPDSICVETANQTESALLASLEPLSSDADRLIGDLYSSQWHSGHGERTRCLGTGDARRALHSTFALKELQQIKRPSGQASLMALEDRQTQPAASRDDRRRGRSLANVRIDLPKPSSWQADKADPHMLRWREHGRRAGKPCCSVPFMIELTVKRIDGNVRVEQSVFVAGELDEHVIWTLES